MSRNLLKNDIVFVSITYDDLSCRIIRGTQCQEYIIDILGELPDMDIYTDTQEIKDNFIFDVTSKKIIDVTGLVVECSTTKPNFNREVDRFANSFI